MTHHVNPFVRGYGDLSIRRLLMITYEDDCQPTYLPLHSSQALLSDAQVQLFPCIFCDRFALITEGQQIADELSEQCPRSGIVRMVVYEITANDFGTPTHVGDTYSAEAAETLVKRLTFETGHFNRCWEISSAHLPKDAMRYLEDLADAGGPLELLFEVFRVPGCDGMGCKLFCTPWADQNFSADGGADADELRLEHRRAGTPESLITILHLAAQADTRILILDSDAPILEGLPVFEE